MNIKVLSKNSFNNLMSQNEITDENVENYKEVFLISINDTETSLYHRKSWFDHDHPNVKVLYFDDVEHENETSPTNSGKCTPFTEDMAYELYNFIKDNLSKSQCIVHCEAGISRSGAVGSFIRDISRSNHYDFMRENSQIYPNARVLSMLNNLERNNE